MLIVDAMEKYQGGDNLYSIDIHSPDVGTFLDQILKCYGNKRQGIASPTSVFHAPNHVIFSFTSGTFKPIIVPAYHHHYDNPKFREVFPDRNMVEITIGACPVDDVENPDEIANAIIKDIGEACCYLHRGMKPYVDNDIIINYTANPRKVAIVYAADTGYYPVFGLL